MAASAFGFMRQRRTVRCSSANLCPTREGPSWIYLLLDGERIAYRGKPRDHCRVKPHQPTIIVSGAASSPAG
jgi:hypothetical protein